MNRCWHMFPRTFSHHAQTCYVVVSLLRRHQVHDRKTWLRHNLLLILIRLLRTSLKHRQSHLMLSMSVIVLNEIDKGNGLNKPCALAEDNCRSILIIIRAGMAHSGRHDDAMLFLLAVDPVLVQFSPLSRPDGIACHRS